MTYTGSTGARWLDVAIMGVGLEVVPAAVGIALLFHPGSSIDPVVDLFLVVIGLFALLCIIGGVWYGKRTRWKVPDPSRAKIR